MDVAVELLTTRPFAAGAFRFTVSTSDPADQMMIEELFGDLPRPDTADSIGGAFVILRVDVDGDTQWAVDGPQMSDQPMTSRVGALASLMAAVNLSALDAEPESLHLHAAAATRAGRAVVVAASRNTGKTTTVAHLVTRGWAFVTDETVRLPADGHDIGGFSKPLSIKPGGDRLVAHLEPWMLPPGIDGAESFRFVPIGASGAQISAGGRVDLFVLLRRSDDGDPTPQAASRQLHPADAVVALMQETLDAERFGLAAERLATLAASARCHEVMLGPPSETAALIEELAEGPLEPLEVAVLPASPAITDGVVSVAIGDRMVIHHQGTGQIFALDAMASQIWEQLGGWRGHGIDLAGPVVAPFVAQLDALDVLSASTGLDAGAGTEREP